MNLTALPQQLRRQHMAPRIASRRVDRKARGPPVARIERRHKPGGKGRKMTNDPMRQAPAEAEGKRGGKLRE